MPRIIFLDDYTLTVCRNVDSYCQRERPVYVQKAVKGGDVYTVEFLEGTHDPRKDCRLDVQFEDGTIGVGLPNWLFELEEDYGKPSHWR